MIIIMTSRLTITDTVSDIGQDVVNTSDGFREEVVVVYGVAGYVTQEVHLNFPPNSHSYHVDIVVTVIPGLIPRLVRIRGESPVRDQETNVRVVRPISWNQ